MVKAEDTKVTAAYLNIKRQQEVGRRNISTGALEIVSKGARTNPEGENTAVVAELDGETTIFGIFRQRHTGDPLAEADQWIRHVKKHCTGTTGELKATAIWTDADGGSVLVGISGREIIAKEEAGAGLLMTEGPLTPGPEAPLD